MDIKSICVYSSSSNTLDKKYYELADRLGEEMAKRGFDYVFGGGMVGTMGACAVAVKRNGGKAIGIIPEKLNKKGIVYEYCDELIVTPDMRTRKKLLDERSDAFIALPGGFGTLEEIFEVITSKQLGYHSKPIVFMNYDGYYDLLFEMLKKSFDEKFAKPIYARLYKIASDVDEALDYIQNYEPEYLGEKWS